MTTILIPTTMRRNDVFRAGGCMYICLCKGVTDHQIRAAIADGACSMRDLRAALDVANQCGKCGRDCKSLLNESAVSGQAASLPQQWVAA